MQSRTAIFLPALLLLGVSATVWSGPARAQASCGDMVAAASQAVAKLGLDPSEQDGVHQFYDSRRQKGATGGCAWSDDEVAALKTVLSHAGDQGLAPARYHADALGGPASPDRDVAATAMALRYAHDMVLGEVDEARLSDDIDVPRSAIDLPAQLTEAVGGNRVAPWLAGLQPADPQYPKLVKALAAYRQAANGSAPPPLADGFHLKLGQSDQGVAAVKARLRAAGDLRGDDDSPEFDATTQAALTAFQRRHGLKPDGWVGRETLKALNVSPHDRVRTIVVNLERRRYFGHVLAPTRIEVNAAGETATLYRDGRPTLGMRAIVGDPKHPTPMLISAKLDEVVLDPPWIIPASIIHKEMLPKEARDRGYFAAHDIHWSGKSLIQSPGPKNALGRILFDFANRYAVYLHDTPGRSLFANYDRADSHGCVRLQRPIDMAMAVLPQDGRWPRQRIEETIGRNKTVHIAVADGPQIVLAYWTAFVDDNGKVEFRDDIYGRDSRLRAAMPLNRVDESIAAAPVGENCCVAAHE